MNDIGLVELLLASDHDKIESLFVNAYSLDNEQQECFQLKNGYCSLYEFGEYVSKKI